MTPEQVAAIRARAEESIAANTDDTAYVAVDLCDALAASQARVQALEAVLSWYADEDNYCEDTHAPLVRGFIADTYDVGAKARAILAEGQR